MDDAALMSVIHGGGDAKKDSEANADGIAVGR